MPDDNKTPENEPQKHTFMSVATCEGCDCKIVFHEAVTVTAPAGKARDAAINAFRTSVSFMLTDECPLCEECEIELAAMYAAGLLTDDDDEL